MRILFLFISCLVLHPLMGQDTTHVSKDLFLIKLSPHVYVHTSYSFSQNWGKIASNGILVVEGNNAILFDTPMEDTVSLALFDWIENTQRFQLTGFVPNHWHDDCTAGLDLLHEKRVATYGHSKTNTSLFEHEQPMVSTTFTDSLNIMLGHLKIVLYYPGEGHSSDNIVTWIPADKLLFGGCMVKAMEATELGNIADANLNAWPVTISRLQDKFESARIVIPGHGPFGTTSLFRHTLQLLQGK
jgi:metallo-beta-lactamase class B